MQLDSVATAVGRVLMTLKIAWRDGTSHLLLEPIEVLEKLAALTPPRINLVLYHGVWAARALVPPGGRVPTSREAVREQTSAKPPGQRAGRSSAAVSGRVGRERLAGRRSAIHGLGREREAGEDLADFARILNGGDQAQAPAAPRASEDVDLKGATHELGPGPVAVRGFWGASPSLEFGRLAGSAVTAGNAP
jgi:hypothetical protein